MSSQSIELETLKKYFHPNLDNQLVLISALPNMEVQLEKMVKQLGQPSSDIYLF